MSEKQNLTINGSGSYGGGAFHKISIRGTGTITSDLECEIFKIYGSSEALKNVQASEFQVFGDAEVRGNLICNDMKIFGTTKVGGSAAIDHAHVTGTFDVAERFSGDEANIKGTLSVKGDAEFETFKSSGSFAINGLLNAGTIEITLRFGTSTAEEIGGDKIFVKKKNSFLPFLKSEGSLEARVIEGDEIILENTKAEIVRGKIIHIGPGCEIGVVEYQESYKADVSATVNEHRKVN